ncbi:hypothetical protein HYV88_04760 [Candidatus Woesearchaeota archaeon]|nr:hypothetical protein [Candidatus Woesearchaeota archaeon]
MAKIKGMFLTLGFFIVVIIFLGFALIISDSFKTSRERVSDYIVFEKARVLDESVQEGFRNIFDSVSGITIVKGSTVSFTEELPNDNDVNFGNNLTKFNGFINSSYNININTSLSDDLAVWIRPHDIKYYHIDFGDDIIKVQPRTLNFNKYRVDIVTGKVLDGTSCSGSSSGKLDVTATGASGTSCSSSSIARFKLYDNADLLIAYVNVSSNILTIDSETKINVTTNIISLNDLGREVDIKTNDNVLTINFSEYKFFKKSAIRVV